MKKYILAGLLIAGMSCKGTSVDKREDGIKYKETITINDVPKASLTFFDVQDSRCPQGVQCIWAGNATVDLLLSGVTSEGGVSEHVKMCLGNCNSLYKGSPFKESDTLSRSFAGQEYLLILTSVKPDPKADSQYSKEDYSIQLDIKKK